jgi:hypothetical protein
MKRTVTTNKKIKTMKKRNSKAAKQTKGFIGKVGEMIYYTDGKDVYRAHETNQMDVTGYLFGRWECSVTHWNRFSEKLYGLPPVALEKVVTQ